MSLHATIVPRQTNPISCEDLYARFISAGLAQHPNARELETAEERAAWHLTLISDKVGVVSVEEADGTATGTHAQARIPGTTDAELIFNWAHHLWRIAQQADCDVVVGDHRLIRILASYLERDCVGHLQIVKQPPLRESTDGSETPDG